MPKRFKVIGYGRDTGRKRVREYEALDENDARSRAADDATVIDSIVELAPERATARQIEYARHLGVHFPSNISKYKLSILISLRLEEIEAEEESDYERDLAAEMAQLKREEEYDRLASKSGCLITFAWIFTSGSAAAAAHFI